MKILIISDTHGRRSSIVKVAEKVGEVDMVIHLGDIAGDLDYVEEMFDCEIHMIAGNNDFMCGLPREEELEIEGKKVFITHGHLHKVGFGTDDLYELAVRNGYDIVLYGHTHVQKVENHNGIYIANPGSLALPRDGAEGKFILLEFDQNGTPFFAENSLKREYRSYTDGFS